MVIPSRWMAGGRGLDEFRADDARRQAHARTRRLSRSSTKSFPGVEIRGGVSYFLWDRDTRRAVRGARPFADGEAVGPTVARYLDEYDVFVRDNEAVPILREGASSEEASSTTRARVSARQAVRLAHELHGVSRDERGEGDSPALLHPNDAARRGLHRAQAISPRTRTSIDKWKVLVPTGCARDERRTRAAT